MSTRTSTPGKPTKRATSPPSSEPKKDERSRSWATIIYPDSAPEDFRSILSSLQVSGYLSPLHTDIDVDGHEKKPHYHFLAKFSTKKSQEQVSEIFDQVKSVGQERVSDFRSYARYLCHLDQYNKKQYSPSDVLAFGGLDYLTEISSSADKYAFIRDMLCFIDQNPDIVQGSYSRFMRYCRDNQESWFRALCDNCSYVVKEYLVSDQWDKEREEKDSLRKKQEEYTKTLDARIERLRADFAGKPSPEFPRPKRQLSD